MVTSPARTSFLDQAAGEYMVLQDLARHRDKRGKFFHAKDPVSSSWGLNLQMVEFQDILCLRVYLPGQAPWPPDSRGEVARKVSPKKDSVLFCWYRLFHDGYNYSSSLSNVTRRTKLVIQRCRPKMRILITNRDTRWFV